MSTGTANIFMFNILNFSFSIHEEGKDKRINGTMTCSWWGHIKYPRRACKRPLNPYPVVLVYKSLGISCSLTTKPGKCIWYWFLLINVKNTYLENSVLIGYRFEQIKYPTLKTAFKFGRFSTCFHESTRRSINCKAHLNTKDSMDHSIFPSVNFQEGKKKTQVFHGKQSPTTPFHSEFIITLNLLLLLAHLQVLLAGSECKIILMGGSPGNRAKVSLIYGWFTMEHGQLPGAPSTKTTARLKLPFARLSSGQQPRKEEATCENGKSAIEWTASAKPVRKVPMW